MQKRHHTRFFPIRQEDGDKKNGNVKPGTIVDSVITFPDKTDFYLCSHASLQVLYLKEEKPLCLL